MLVQCVVAFQQTVLLFDGEPRLVLLDLLHYRRARRTLVGLVRFLVVADRFAKYELVLAASERIVVQSDRL